MALKSIWLVTSEPEPTGRGDVYLGALTIPFKDFSFVVKVQCQEQGTTGLREALVLDFALKGGSATLVDGNLLMQRYLADDEQFDSMVPDHPLSRVRRELRQIADSLRIDEPIKKKRPFGLPEVGP